MRRLLLIVPLLLFLVLAGFFLQSLMTKEEGVTELELPSPLLNKPFPTFDLPSVIDGEPRITQADLKGPALVNIWATWCVACRVEHPVLLPDEMAALRAFPGFPAATLDLTYGVESRPEALEAALDALGRRAEAAARKGARLLILSDRKAGAARVPIPALLALGAVRQHLVRAGLRARVGLVVEAGDALD